MENGDRSALDRLTPILYDELRRLAAVHMRRGFQSETMRTILVDHARSKAAAKRGSGGCAIALREDMAASPQSSTDVLALHDALEALSRQDQRKASIVEMRYFGGMTVAEIPEALSISGRYRG